MQTLMRSAALSDLLLWYVEGYRNDNAGVPGDEELERICTTFHGLITALIPPDNDLMTVSELMTEYRNRL